LLNDTTKQKTAAVTELTFLKKSIMELKSEKKQLEMKPALEGDTSLDMKSKLDTHDTMRNKLYADKDVYAYVTSLFKDGGVKTSIIKEYIDVINHNINANLAALDFFVEFELDEEFNETIRSRFRDDFSYSSFSEGEKARINLAILFAWRAIARARNSAATNIVIMDEVFDSSLDSSGADDFMKMLHKLVQTTNAFVISHKTDQVSDKFDRIIRFEKVKNFSQVVQSS
jgi:hypothetical protein